MTNDSGLDGSRVAVGSGDDSGGKGVAIRIEGNGVATDAISVVDCIMGGGGNVGVIPSFGAWQALTSMAKSTSNPSQATFRPFSLDGFDEHQSRSTKNLIREAITGWDFVSGGQFLGGVLLTNLDEIPWKRS